MWVWRSVFTYLSEDPGSTPPSQQAFQELGLKVIQGEGQYPCYSVGPMWGRMG